jgi:hypothetical protein
MPRVQNKKFELVKIKPSENVFKIEGLYRVRALRDFGDVKAGELGGIVDSENCLSHTGNCWIADDAMVLDARVSGNARIYMSALIGGGAQISGDVSIGGSVEITCSIKISGNGRVFAWPPEIPTKPFYVRQAPISKSLEPG